MRPRLFHPLMRPRALRRPSQLFAAYSTQTLKSDPLNILFCGSDEFSCRTLGALHDEHKINPELIESISVVVRPAKPAGRGMKTLREVPMKSYAQSLGLPIYERDTFTGWDLPGHPHSPINIIIAVSFGLFVPARLLRECKYGGLNVHPSLLPHLAGPAPIHHAIFHNLPTTGLTLQTLSPTAFDAGTILAQTRVDIPPFSTTTALASLLTAAAPPFLLHGLRTGLHVSPSNQTPPAVSPLLHAPKVTPADREIPWLQHITAVDLERRFRAFGPLWTRASARQGGWKRIILADVAVAEVPVEQWRGWEQEGLVEGLEVMHSSWDGEDGTLAVRFVVAGEDGILVAVEGGKDVKDGTMSALACLKIGSIKVEGQGTRPAAEVIQDFARRL